ncbi:MAG: hypothetical protein Q4D98_14055 [Planctomycetia bacterium]|nr:hypothetical protein [Planctomycetia bacterium]
MAKSKVIDRKRQRAPMEDDELDNFSSQLEDEEVMEESKPKKKAAPRKKAASKKRAEVVTPREVRLKAFWAVYTQSLQRVKLFPYSDREGADALAAELTESRKAPHFVRLEKQVIDG